MNTALAIPLLLEKWLSLGQSPRIICDAQNKVLWQCPKIPGFLSQNSAMRIDRDQLFVADKRANAALTDFISAADQTEAAIGLECAGSGRTMILQCQHLKIDNVASAVGLRVVVGTDTLDLEFREFERYFGLTRQEGNICRLLIQGKTVQDIVVSEAKSADTIRFHIRNIYHKVDVSSREAFFAKIMLFNFS